MVRGERGVCRSLCELSQRCAIGSTCELNAVDMLLEEADPLPNRPSLGAQLAPDLRHEQIILDGVHTRPEALDAVANSDAVSHLARSHGDGKRVGDGDI